jgi:hypothetical protein
MESRSMQVGQKEALAFVIGRYYDYPHRRCVDIWVAGVHLTNFDNAAYLSSFIPSLERELAYRSRNDSFSEFAIDGDTKPAATHLAAKASEDWTHRFLDLGPTTDGAIVFLFRASDQDLITFGFSDAGSIAADHIGKIFSVKIPQTMVQAIFRQVITILQSPSSPTIAPLPSAPN